MAKFTNHVTGTEKVLNNLLTQKIKIIGRVAKAVEYTCLDILKEAQENHVRGEAHAMGRFESQHGAGGLVGSMGVGTPRITADRIIGEVGTNQKYAAFVELGTSRSRPYPYLFPALTRNMQKFKNRVAEAIKS